MQNVYILKQKFHETILIYITYSAHSIFKSTLFRIFKNTY